MLIYGKLTNLLQLLGVTLCLGYHTHTHTHTHIYMFIWQCQVIYLFDNSELINQGLFFIEVAVFQNSP